LPESLDISAKDANFAPAILKKDMPDL